MREFYAKRKLRLKELKQNRACSRCGFDDPRALTFHHRNPAEKSFPIARDAWKVSWERLVAEVAKCDILCANCHMIEHDDNLPDNGRFVEDDWKPKTCEECGASLSGKRVDARACSDRCQQRLYRKGRKDAEQAIGG